MEKKKDETDEKQFSTKLYKHAKFRQFRVPFQDRKRKRVFCCVNCGREGHVYKECHDPITSFGIVAIRKNTETTSLGPIISVSREFCENHEKSELPDKIPLPDTESDILYLMVQRKDTMGYIDFIRGKYPENNAEEKAKILKVYLEEMTCEERKRLVAMEFKDLWDLVWMNHASKCYINEYMEAKRRFEKLNIKRLISKTKCCWTEQEYGFPKGRKNMYENNIQCAMREFREESGYYQQEIKLVNDKPWEEIFTGTNGICYRHVYYVAEVPENIGLPKIDILNIQQAGEISNCGWFTFNQCIKIMRPYDVEKKNILSLIHEKYKKRYKKIDV